jgi:branched-chain amino acid aminotransferase
MTVRQSEWVFHNGDFIRTRDLLVGCGTQALQYGTGVFEGIRSYASDTGSTNLFRAHEHFSRMFYSARFLRINITQTAGELVDASVELLRRNGHVGDAYVRPLAYKVALEPGTPFGVRLRGVSSALTITSLPMGSYVPKDGIRCAVSSWRKIPGSSLPSMAKVTGMYVSNAIATDEVTYAGYDDAIFLNQAGNVAEATTANIFLVRDGGVFTPGLDSDILAGVTRSSVMELLERDFDVTVVERTVPRYELYAADEVFLTGTGCEIVPVIEIDGHLVGTGTCGPVTKSVAQAYERTVRGTDKRDHNWLTKVKLCVTSFCSGSVRA